MKRLVESFEEFLINRDLFLNEGSFGGHRGVIDYDGYSEYEISEIDDLVDLVEFNLQGTNNLLMMINGVTTKHLDDENIITTLHFKDDTTLNFSGKKLKKDYGRFAYYFNSQVYSPSEYGISVKIINKLRDLYKLMGKENLIDEFIWEIFRRVDYL